MGLQVSLLGPRAAGVPVGWKMASHGRETGRDGMGKAEASERLREGEAGEAWERGTGGSAEGWAREEEGEEQSRGAGLRGAADTRAALSPQGQGGRGWALGRTGSQGSPGTAQTGWARSGAGSESQGPAKGGGGAAN